MRQKITINSAYKLIAEIALEKEKGHFFELIWKTENKFTFGFDPVNLGYINFENESDIKNFAKLMEHLSQAILNFYEVDNQEIKAEIKDISNEPYNHDMDIK